MKDQETDKNELNVCIECGLHYGSKVMMEKCQAWCAQYNSVVKLVDNIVSASKGEFPTRVNK